jgi:hypothetical protein
MEKMKCHPGIKNVSDFHYLTKTAGTMNKQHESSVLVFKYPRFFIQSSANRGGGILILSRRSSGGRHVVPVRILEFGLDLVLVAPACPS